MDIKNYSHFPVPKEILLLLRVMLLISPIRHTEESQYFYSSVQWKVVNRPVVFGGDLILKCRMPISTFSCVSTSRWTRGHDNALIAFNNATYNKKYTSERNNICSDYYLYIHDVNESDMTDSYTCWHGYVNFTKMLTLESDTFEKHPDYMDLQWTYGVQDKTLEANFTMINVFPAPKCQFYLEEADVFPENKQTKGVFYTTEWKIVHTVYARRCNFVMTLDCYVGNKKIYLRKKIQKCKNEYYQLIFPGLFDAVFIIAVYGAMFYFCIFKNK
ncbi:uncharacterized protein LOC127711502 isoform X2 [Mytilus californianus]|uniref:uncharacterized protein LOC127711502 isoform X2 n=1 Tax=Mytilus californianus TaxID=6549 RepID=UPI002247CB5E|nr:uncharacterized protein LOC127711502 isoform X2 [Mytilus californianus]